MTKPTTPRATRQRAAVSAALAESGEFRSAQDLHALLRERDEAVGLTTVYRCLQALSAAGEIDAVRRDDGEVVYRRCSPDHHHHLTCRSCNSTVEIEAPDVEAWARSVAAAHAYTQVSHTVELVGLCPACAAATAVKGG